MVSHYVAEWYNTLSNILAVCLGLNALRLSNGLRRAKDPAVLACYISCLLAVFSGSFCFHATLKYTSQMLDEIPMIYGACLLHYAFRPSAMSARVLVVIALVITVCMALWQVMALRLAYGSLVGSLIVRSVAASSRAGKASATAGVSNNNSVPSLLAPAACIYGFGLILWLMEQFFCPHTRWIQLHAWWHCLTGVGTYLWIEYCAARGLRRAGKKVACAWTVRGMIPFIYEDGTWPKERIV